MLEPYYEGGGVVLYLGDCRDLLSSLEPESADLLLTDPPYGQSWQSGHRRLPFEKIAGDRDQEVAIGGLRAALRVLKPQRHVYVFGPFSLDGFSMGGTAELVWDKGEFNGGDLSLPFGSQHEYIQFGCYRPSKANRENGGGYALCTVAAWIRLARAASHLCSRAPYREAAASAAHAD